MYVDGVCRTVYIEELIGNNFMISEVSGSALACGNTANGKVSGTHKNSCHIRTAVEHHLALASAVG